MNWRLLVGDVREKLAEIESGSVQTCVTSPPYWGLRDYGTAKWEGGATDCDHAPPDDAGATTKPTSGQRTHAGRFAGKECWRCGATRIDSQIGLEATPDAFCASLVGVFREVRRTLKDDGTIWVNLGDSYLAQQGSGFNGQKRLDHANRNVKVQRPVGMKPKDLAGIPWMVAFALRADGWYLRSDIIWSKPNPMPESVTDRPTKAHEYIFLLSKRQQYFYDAEAIRERAVKVGTPAHLAGGGGERAGTRGGLRRDEWMARKRVQEPGYQPLVDDEVSGHPIYTKPYTGQATKDYEGGGAQNPSDVKRRIVEKILSGELDGRNCRSVWSIPTQPYPEAHFATFPEEVPTRCILAGSRSGDLVLDPFTGSGTTGQVALQLGRQFVGVELNPTYAELARKRIGGAAPLFAEERPA